MSDLSRRKWLSLLVSLLVCNTVHADDLSPQFHFSGFGTLGFAYNDSSRFDYVRDLSQASGVGATRRVDFGVDSLLGLQLRSIATDNLEATVQVVSRRSQNGFRPQLTWAFAKYAIGDTIDLRAGRLGFDVYPLADSRNVAYSYLGVRPPVEYFGNLIISYLDGFDAVLKYPIGSAHGKLKIFTGKAKEGVPTFDPQVVFSLKDSPLAGIHTEFQSQNWIARLGYSELRIQNEFPSFPPLLETLRSPFIGAVTPLGSGVADHLQFKNKKIRYLSAVVGYDDGPFQAQWMFSRITSQSLGFASNASAFMTLGYRVKAWTPYLTLSQTHPIDIQHVETGIALGYNILLDQLDASVKQVALSTLSRRQNISLGVRYNINASSDLKIQFDHFNSKEHLLIRNERPGWNGTGNIVSASMNFIF